MRNSRFSIVITCHNQRDFIRDAVDSALSQLTTKKEIIVVDDASKDGSWEVLKQYGEAIRLVLPPDHIGAAEARNYGASLAKGDYLVFLDGDDALMPWALEIYDRLITERNPMLILARPLWFKGSIPQVRNEDEPRKIEFVEYSQPMLKDRSGGLYGSAFIVDRQAFQVVGGWSPSFWQLDLQDIISKLGYSGRMILIFAPTTAFYRIHSGNVIHTVGPFVQAAHRLIEKEKAGQFPGGREHRFERFAWMGGFIFFYIKRALRAGLYKEALKLAACGWKMIAAGVVRRCAVRIRGRRPIETIEFTRKDSQAQITM